MIRVLHASLFDEPSPENVAKLLKIVSDPTRLDILGRLAEGDAHAGSLCLSSGLNGTAASYHISMLRACGLIETRGSGLSIL